MACSCDGESAVCCRHSVGVGRAPVRGAAEGRVAPAAGALRGPRRRHRGRRAAHRGAAADRVLYPHPPPCRRAPRVSLTELVLQAVLVLLLLVPRGPPAPPLRPQVRRLPQGTARHHTHRIAHSLLVRLYYNVFNLILCTGVHYSFYRVNGHCE